MEARSTISLYQAGFGTGRDIPPIEKLDIYFRQHGVRLAAQACKKALQEWGGNKEDITHTVGVTCTSQGNPGYDVLVNYELGLSLDVDRTLLHGVGCAGGLAILRTAAQLADGATAKGRAACILGFACELCTPNLQHELAAAERSSPHEVGIAAAIFSDGAAAFVLCNDRGRIRDIQPLFQLIEFGSTLLPDTTKHVSFHASSEGTSSGSQIGSRFDTDPFH
jgi:type III polyketide synthase